MFKKLAPWIATLKEDFAGAVDAQTKRQVLADAKVALDGLLNGHPGATAIANFIMDELASQIK